MTNKYIIKNCPAILKMTKICDDYRTTRDNPQLCKDCTDCVLKQIVKKCKSTLSINKDSENEFTLGKMTFAEFILKDIDIEDAEDEK